MTFYIYFDVGVFPDKSFQIRKKNIFAKCGAGADPKGTKSKGGYPAQCILAFGNFFKCRMDMFV